MEDLLGFVLREQSFFAGQVVKKVLVEGNGEILCQGSKVTLKESVFSESQHLLFESSEKTHKIMLYPDNSIISPYDTVLLSMKSGEKAWVCFPYTHHNVKDNEWETLYYNIEILSVDSAPDLLLYPENAIFLREHRFGLDKTICKRVLQEGIGDTANITSNLTYNYEIVLENGCSIESNVSKLYLLTRNPSPSMHYGLHLAFYSMRANEKALIKLPPGSHVSEKFLNNTVWVNVFISQIVFSKDLVFPQNSEFLYEEVLKTDRSVIKRVVKEGNGPLMGTANKVWIELHGRLENGYQFQKLKNEVITMNTSKIYSEAVELGLKSMKRGEIAWIRAEPDTHIYKEYENEVLWLNFYVKEYLEPYKKISPQMDILEKLAYAFGLLEIAKRLYSSGTKKECRVIYNDIITALTLKKGVFTEFEDSCKVKYIDVKGRAMMNLALMLIKEVEDSEKEDFKIKTLQKVLDMCEELLQYDETNIKGLYRRGTAYFYKRMYSESLQDFSKIISLQPNNREVTNFIRKIEQETNKTSRKERKMYKGIFTGSAWAEESLKEASKVLKNNESQRQLEEEWQKQQNLLKAERETQQKAYENALKVLESGVVIDTNDATDPLTDLFLLDTE